jgi:diguanylate cyclase (GGDEF)-like protein/putative nucleotidyltransferase with HDIG domain
MDRSTGSAYRALAVASTATVWFARARRAKAACAAEIERLEQMATTDPLTGLRNHRAFHEDLTRDLQRVARGGSSLALVMLDLDDLKSVNDDLGHQAGDQRLRDVADAIGSVQRAADGTYRIGGDEFAVILPDVGAAEALRFTKRLSSRLSSGIRTIAVTAGIAEALELRDKEDLIRDADFALISAKRFQQAAAIYTPAMRPGGKGPPAADGDHDHRTRQLSIALARAVDAKDSYSRGHSQAVSRLCGVVARELKLEEEQVARMRMAGLLHDVGKIAVPDTILQKPETLTDAEYERIKRHAALGADIVRAADMAPEAEYVHHSHERIDGSGYPDGLAGPLIPMESRIIHVVEAFQAMISDRPFRPARTRRYAIDQLLHHSGTQFDPLVVQALMRGVRETVGMPPKQQPITITR